MFSKAYCPNMIPKIMNEWTDQLKSNKLPFVPENIMESEQFKD